MRGADSSFHLFEKIRKSPPRSIETGGGDFLTKRRVENVWLYGNSILAESYTGTRADSPVSVF